MNFTQLNLRDPLLRAITDMGYHEPSPIQEQSIPYLISGQDVLGQSHTGSGKTAAFGLPILHNIQTLPTRKTVALILLPTRELCLQVADEMRKFAKYIEGVRIVSVYGGQPINRQIADIKKGSDIVVATPGRLLDHIRRRTLRFDFCHTVVLDEADEMLNMGFLEDVNEIISHLPKARQTVLFSATMPKAIQQLANNIQTNPVHIKLSQDNLTLEAISQVGYHILPSEKTTLLTQLLEIHKPKSTMIFCNTKRMVDDLTNQLNNKGYKALSIHGDMKQEMRTVVMKRFKEKSIDLLVCTDVAARGIDVDAMDLVINYDLPNEIDYYVHRIGRTGRAGNTGTAINFITPRQKGLLRDIEKLTQSKVEIKPVPTKEDLSKLTVSMIEQEIRSGLNNQISNMEEIITSLNQKGLSTEDILNGLLSKIIDKQSIQAITPIKKPSRQRDNQRSSKGYSSILVNVGKKHGVSPGHLVSAFAEAGSFRGKEIGRIVIQDRSAIVDVPSEYESILLDQLPDTLIKGKPIYASVISKKQTEKRKPRRKRK